MFTVLSRCVRGVWEPMKTELMKPSVTTKLCAVAAILFHTFNQPQHDIIYISFTGTKSARLLILFFPLWMGLIFFHFCLGLFLSVKLASIFGQSVNPLAPMETIFWGFLGAFQESGDETTAAHKKSDWFFPFLLHVAFAIKILLVNNNGE